MKMKLLVLLLPVALIACAPRSQMRPVNGSVVMSPHSEQVCMLKGPLPGGVAFTELGEIRSSKKSYGSVEELLPLMARDARAAGAHAVINLAANQRGGVMPWGIVRPKGIGTAVRLADPASFNCVASGGELR